MFLLNVFGIHSSTYKNRLYFKLINFILEINVIYETNSNEIYSLKILFYLYHLDEVLTKNNLKNIQRM